MNMETIRRKARQEGFDLNEDAKEIAGHFVSINYGGKLTITTAEITEGSWKDADKMRDELTTMLALYCYMYGNGE